MINPSPSRPVASFGMPLPWSTRPTIRLPRAPTRWGPSRVPLAGSDRQNSHLIEKILDLPVEGLAVQPQRYGIGIIAKLKRLDAELAQSVEVGYCDLTEPPGSQEARAVSRSAAASFSRCSASERSIQQLPLPVG